MILYGAVAKHQSDGPGGASGRQAEGASKRGECRNNGHGKDQKRRAGRGSETTRKASDEIGPKQQIEEEQARWKNTGAKPKSQKPDARAKARAKAKAKKQQRRPAMGGGQHGRRRDREARTVMQHRITTL